MKSLGPALLLAAALLAPILHADDYDTLRLRWREMLVGPSSYTITTALTTQLNLLATTVASNGSSRDAANGTGHWDKLDTSAGRTYLWSDLSSTTSSAHITSSYSRLRAMALAYATYGSTLHGNTALRDDIIAALDWMNANRYGPTTTSYDNWWDWDIGCPLALNDLTIILHAELTSTQIADYMAAIENQNTGVYGSGANRTWTSRAIGLRGVIVKDSSRITAMKNGLSSVFDYKLATSDGFNVDGSFVQHDTVAYNGGYGVSCIVDLLDIMYLLNGSTWAVTDADKANVHAFLKDSFEPLVYRGEFMDMVRGREISRYDATSHKIGRKVLPAFLRATQLASPADTAHFKSVIKHWLQSDTTLASTYEGLSVDGILLAEPIMADGAVAPRAELLGYYQFAGMDRALKLADGWAAGVAMHSSRVKNYESANSENKKAWNTGFGMLHVHTADQQQFSQNFWPTINAYRLPGTTTEAGNNNAANVGTATFVGGVESYDFQSGVSAMDLAPYNRTLRGRKAWFFLDDEIVCLGAGITATGGKTLESIVENRRLNTAGDNAFLVNGSAAVATLQAAPATVTSLSGVNYAHLAGNVAGGDIGYYFPGGANLGALRETRTGKWTDINTNPARSGYTTTFTNHYLTLYYDHGIDPAAASYSYALLPNYSATAVQNYAAAPQYSVLENSTDAQAVKDTVNHSIGAVFWQDATKTVGTGADAVTSDKKAAVFVAFGDTIDVTVSDPTKLNTGAINIEIGRAAAATVANDASITVTQLSPTIKFTVDANLRYGHTQRVRFTAAVLSVSTLAAITGDGRALLSWSAPAGAATYKIKRATTSGGPYTTIATGQTATNYTDTGLTNGTAYHYVVTAVAAGGAEAPDSNETSVTPTAITLTKDNADATGITITGAWTASTSVAGYYGANYLSDGNTGATGGKSVTFAPTVTTKGYYDVYVRWTSHTNRATNVPIDVASSTGTTTYSANQKSNNGVWVLLGNHLFEAGSTGSVKVRNDGANGYVVADAVQLVLR